VSKQVSFPLIQQHTYPGAAAQRVTRVELPTEGYITHLDCQLRVNVTTVGVPAGAPLEDPLSRLIKALRIKASGRRSYVDMDDGRQWDYFARFQYGNKLQRDALPLAGVTADMYWQMPVHLGLFPGNFGDISVPIPAAEINDLIMEIQWGTTADLGTVPADYTINNGEIIVTLHELTLAPGEDPKKVWPGGIPSPRFEAIRESLAAGHNNFSLESDFPVGDTIRNTLMLMFDSSDNRSDLDVTELTVKFPKQRENPWERQWRQFRNNSQRKYGWETLIPGVARLDGSEISGRPVGLDLTRAIRGDVKLGFSNTVTGGEIQLLHYMMS
jgi:hypothetical protein